MHMTFSPAFIYWNKEDAIGHMQAVICKQKELYQEHTVAFKWRRNAYKNHDKASVRNDLRPQIMLKLVSLETS